MINGYIIFTLLILILIIVLYKININEHFEVSNETIKPSSYSWKDLLSYNTTKKFKRHENIISKQNNMIDIKMSSLLMGIKDEVIYYNNTINISTDKEITDNILREFIKYINTKQSDYLFTVLETGKISSSLQNIKEQIYKYYNIPLFIYENKFNFIKRFTLNIYYNKNTMIIKNISIPKDLDIFNKHYDNYIKKNNANSFIRNNIKKKEIINDELISKEEYRQKKLKELELQYNCYGIPQSEKISSKEECELYDGIWDRAVQADYECPFYIANKNYPNSNGGKNIGGYCNLPSNMKNKGFRGYKLSYKPLCYNCKTELTGNGTEGYCCDAQLNASLYPGLKSPDYKYNGDDIEREYYKYELATLGLLPK